MLFQNIQATLRVPRLQGNSIFLSQIQKKEKQNKTKHLFHRMGNVRLEDEDKEYLPLSGRRKQWLSSPGRALPVRDQGC